MRTYQSRTLLRILLALRFCTLSNSPQIPVQPCQSTLYLTGTPFLSSHIFLPIYWQSLPSIFSIDFNEHFHHYFTPRPSIFYTWREISVFPPCNSWKTIVLERTANFEQVLWVSFCLNYSDLLFWRQIHRRYTN